MTVVKKLKLVGTPLKVGQGGETACLVCCCSKPLHAVHAQPCLVNGVTHGVTMIQAWLQVHRHTAFIGGMFSSQLEAAR